MEIKTALLFGSRSFWQLRRSTAANHLRGAMIAIALSLIPLVVVMVVANGMIEGITYRLIEIFTYHLQVPLGHLPDSAGKVTEGIMLLPGVKSAHIEQSSFALVRAGSTSAGSAVRAVPPGFLQSDQGFQRNFNLLSGDLYLETVPPFIQKEIFETRILARTAEAEQQLLLSAYTLDRDRNGYALQAESLTESMQQLTRLFKSLKYSTVIIGAALAEKIEAGIGDQVYLVTAISLGKRKIPRSSKFIISGIFSTGYQDVDRYILYIPLETGRKILVKENSREYIGIKVDDPFADLNPVMANVANVLKQFNVRYNTIETWYNKQRYQFQSFKSTRASLIFIMCVIILVAAVNVYSSIHMLVIGKIKEIAIMKSMGTKPGTITLSFLFTGFLTGIAGTIMGISLGLLLAVNINEVMRFIEKIINHGFRLFTDLFSQAAGTENLKPFRILNPDFYLEQIPIRISFQDVSFIALFSIMVATLASCLPARNAGKVRPLEIIRRY